MRCCKLAMINIPRLFFVLLVLGVSFHSYGHGPIQVEAQHIDINSFPPIEEDIQALANYGSSAQQAGQRLVERSYDALNALHAALLDPAATFPQKLQLITVLGEIGEAGSVEFILDVANDTPDSRYLYQNTLLALAKFEPTGEIREFVDQQLVPTNRDPLIQRSALAYYAEQPAAEATQWVTKYAAADASPDVRYAALYLGGRLGMASVKDDIVAVLQTKQKNTREYYLLLGLADITTPEEFAQLTAGLQLDAGNLAKVTQYNLFRNADAAEKDEMAKAMLAKGDQAQKNAALTYLLKNKNADALADNWQQGDGFVRGAVKRSGFVLDVTETGAQFKAREPMPNDLSRHWLAIVLVALLLVAGLLYMQRRSKR